MARINRAAYVPDGLDGIEFFLGPGSYTVDQLRAAWEALPNQTNGLNRRNLGRRPWAYWCFELAEERPDGPEETVRLAELGELSSEEVAALRERGTEARLRVGTPAEQISGGNIIDGKPSSPSTYSLDQHTANLWERVEAALK